MRQVGLQSFRHDSPTSIGQEYAMLHFIFFHTPPKFLFWWSICRMQKGSSCNADSDTPARPPVRPVSDEAAARRSPETHPQSHRCCCHFAAGRNGMQIFCLLVVFQLLIFFCSVTFMLCLICFSVSFLAIKRVH